MGILDPDSRILRALKIKCEDDEELRRIIATVDAKARLLQLEPDEQTPSLLAPVNNTTRNVLNSLGIHRLFPNPAFLDALDEQEKSLNPLRVWYPVYHDYSLKNQTGEDFGAVKLVALQNPKTLKLREPLALAVGLNASIADRVRVAGAACAPEYYRLFDQFTEEQAKVKIGPGQESKSKYVNLKSRKVQATLGIGTVLLTGATFWAGMKYNEHEQLNRPGIESTYRPDRSPAPLPDGSLQVPIEFQDVVVVHSFDNQSGPKNYLYRFTQQDEFVSQFGEDVVVFCDNKTTAYKHAFYNKTRVLENSAVNFDGKKALKRILEENGIAIPYLIEILCRQRQTYEPGLLITAQVRSLMKNSDRPPIPSNPDDSTLYAPSPARRLRQFLGGK
jgi:hypothetical protein